MERQGFKLPLLIGGATTSRAHTAVKIAPHYSGPVVHVLDASRSVGVVSSLLSDEQRPGFLEQTRADYQRLREEHAGKTREKKMLTLEAARANRTLIDWSAYQPPRPEFTGVRALEVPLETLIDFIDWSPFFHTWELRGRFPAIFDDPVVGKEARDLYDDAQKLLKRIIEEKRYRARGVYALWPANAVGDDVALYPDETRREPFAHFRFLRQQMQKPADQQNHSLSDYVAPRETGLADYLGGFAVAIHGGDEFAREFQATHDDYNSIMAKALADRFAEAFAEYLHLQARIAWGYGASEALSKEDLIRERYQGIRPAAGYPAAPDHTEKPLLFRLLEAEKNAGAVLTESCMMLPGAAVSGLYFSHPEAKYFGVGKIERDQVEDYAARKGESVEFIRKWLAPNLNE